MIVEQLYVPDMTGPHCLPAIEQAIKRVPGVQTVQINLSARTVRVLHDGRTDVSWLIQAIQWTGYRDVAVLV